MPQKPNVGAPKTDPKATIGDAIGYVKQDPGTALKFVRWLGGLLAALFRRGKGK